MNDWRDNELVTQQLGLTWITNADSLLLRVPSVILPESTNILLNPLHPDACHIKIVDVIPFPFDERLVS